MNHRASMLVCAAALALPLSASVTLPASAQSALTDSIMSTLGFLPPEQPEITYRERAPLVVPPSTEMLPPPRDATAVANDPSWPKDPDETRRKQAAIDAAKPVIINDNHAQRALKPSELIGRPSTASRESPGRATGENAAKRPGWLTPAEMGFTGWGSMFGGSTGEKPLVFEGEPEREALIQPPVGYQTPAPNAPYGTVSQRKKEWSLPSWFDRTQKNNDRN